MWELGKAAQEEAGETRSLGVGQAQQGSRTLVSLNGTPEVEGELCRGSVPGTSSQPWDQVSQAHQLRCYYVAPSVKNKQKEVKF